MMSLRRFTIGLGLAFGLPWLALIVIPAVKAQRLAPLSYEKERDGLEGQYPNQFGYRQGEHIYLQQGCAQCHTQMIRPTYAGVMDGWRKGWGSDQSDQPKLATRSSNIRDFMNEPVAPLGTLRIGPDLANAGYRLNDEKALHVKLYAPRSIHKWSVMPSYRNLYTVQKIQGNGSPHALELSGEFAPEEGYEVVPTPQAVELVKYLTSLKKDAPLPGQVPAEDSK